MMISHRELNSRLLWPLLFSFCNPVAYFRLKLHFRGKSVITDHIFRSCNDPILNIDFRLKARHGQMQDRVKNVWNWFKKVLRPTEESREALNKCACAGQTFGEVLGTALSVLLWPLQKLMEGVGWLCK